jgi:hypothetical protein
MVEITNELIYEILKQLQAGQAEMKAVLTDHTRQLLRIRDNINCLRGADLRIESMQA